MTPEDLKHLRACRMTVESRREAIIRLRAEMERTTTTLRADAGHSSGYEKDKLLRQIARLEELEARHSDALLDCEKALADAYDYIDSLPPEEGTLMRLRYIDGLPWRQVARIMRYSDRGIYRLHKMAMDKLK